MPDVTIRQVRSANRTTVKQRDTLRSLKLGRIGKQTTFTDGPNLRGMIRVVEHLVEVSGGEAEASS
jgi:large subunit ribosomal protein L30